MGSTEIAGAQGTTAEPAAPAACTHALPWREKISYGLADMGFNFYWANIATFLMIFYTDVFGISGLAAGTMLFAIKFINAFTDPIIGAVADRTNTRFGKFRPYLIWMAVPLAAAGVLTYTTPNLSGDGKLIYAYATYLFMMVCYCSTDSTTSNWPELRTIWQSERHRCRRTPDVVPYTQTCCMPPITANGLN